MRNYTAKYTKIESGYMGQLIEWPEVITEADTIENCRTMLRDCLNEMVLAYNQMNKEIPYGTTFYENISMDLENVGQA
jgi:predicted RNase H-like HicB family nuclease